MNHEPGNLLYLQPKLDRKIGASKESTTFKMCKQMFDLYLQRVPSSILEMKSGTGKELNALSSICPDCVGIDARPSMIRYAQSRYTRLNFILCDMLSCRLGLSFEAILSLRRAISYLLTDEEVEQTLQTFVAHSRRGTLLILELLNAASNISDNYLTQDREGVILAHKKYGYVNITNSLYRQQNFLEQERIWKIPGQEPIIYSRKYRLFFPAEVERLLEAKGFEVVGMFDNLSLGVSHLDGHVLYVAAIFHGKPSVT